ncbi:hypothetical protein L1049_004829 [Liquidambar formosana]|uniref:ADP-ribosylation factor GTPase-activating protein AGD14 n=1 Tax=Liquidambar formosana TaxID=63359 RepID=A0AAP0WYJ8_LIQFO
MCQCYMSVVFLPLHHVSNISVLTPGSGAVGPAAASSGTATLFPISGGDTFTKVNNVGQFPSIQQPQHSLFPNADSQSTAPQFIASVSSGLNNQFWSSSSASNAQGSLSIPTLQSSQGVPELIHNTVSEVISQSQPLEAKSMGRKELPEDLFTATYASVPIAVPGWQAVPPRGMGYGMQYPTAMHLPAFPQSSKSSNPFDLINEPTLVQVPTFPSMAPLQGALPNLPAQRVLLRTSSLGSPSPQWIPTTVASLCSSNAFPAIGLSFEDAFPAIILSFGNTSKCIHGATNTWQSAFFWTSRSSGLWQ